LPGELTIGGRALVRGGEGDDRLGGHGGVGELHGAVDRGVEDLVRKASTTRWHTSRACSVRGSNMVIRMPSSSRRGLMRSCTFSIVSTSSATPRSAKYSASSGMITP